jgi:Domain of Unknown Function (DUF928)
MVSKTTQFKFVTSGISLSLAAIALTTGWTARAQATSQAKALTSSSAPTWEISLFDPPVDRGAPTTEGGASRGAELCSKVTALQPQDLNIKTYPPYFGVTVAQQPTFFWHFNTPDEYAGAELTFTLLEYNAQTREAKQVYQEMSTYPEAAGVVAVQIPANLEVGKNYHWYLEMDCISSDVIEVGSIEGWVERIEASSELSQQLSRAKTAIERTQVYARAGVWFDALNTLAQARMTADSSTLKASWLELLQDVNKHTLENNAAFIESQSAETADERGVGNR